MAVRTREELLTLIKERVGDSATDEDLAFIEDLVDTFDDYEKRTGESKTWEEKYNENDKMWREKYKARFFGSSGMDERVEDAKEDVEEKTEVTSYEELFKEE